MNDSLCVYWIELLEGPRCVEKFPVPLNLRIVDYVRTKVSKRIGKPCFVEVGLHQGEECFSLGIQAVAGTTPPSSSLLAKHYQTVYDLIQEAAAAVQKEDFEVIVRQP